MICKINCIYGKPRTDWDNIFEADMKKAAEFVKA
jgi:hypothetical protein